MAQSVDCLPISCQNIPSSLCWYALCFYASCDVWKWLIDIEIIYHDWEK